MPLAIAYAQHIHRHGIVMIFTNFVHGSMACTAYTPLSCNSSIESDINADSSPIKKLAHCVVDQLAHAQLAQL